jgi:hypothetical protein
LYDVLIKDYDRFGNTAIQLLDEDGSPYDIPSINPDMKLEADEVAFHPAPYHAPCISFLVAEGWVAAAPHRHVTAGAYTVGVHRLLKVE